ncbi:MAG: response regulator [Agriterribacter sp.]
MIKIVIADDHPEVRNAWSAFLAEQENMTVVALCTDGIEVVKAVADHQPDIVLMDINMKQTSGIDATKIITQQHPNAKVIAVSLHGSALYIKKMIDAGAKGYIIKHNVAEELLEAIHDVYNGKLYFNTEVQKAIGK